MTDPYTDEDVERIAQEMLGIQEPDNLDDDTDPEVDDDLGDEELEPTPPTDDEEGDPASTTGLPSSESDTSVITATSALSPEQLLSYVQIDAVLNARPDLRQFIEETIKGGPPAPAPTPQPDLPSLPQLDEDALSDPAIRALYDSNAATLAALAAERERVNQLTATTQVRTQQEFTARAIEAKAAFATEHGLDPAKVEAVAKRADELGISQAQLSRTTDVAGAVRSALDLAYWSMPEFRTAAIEDAVKSRTAKNRKRQKLAGVGGGSGANPRSNAPMSDEDRKAAMIKEVADGWFGQTQDA